MGNISLSAIATENIPEIAYTSLTDMVMQSIEQFADEVAFEVAGTEMTYREVGNHARHLAGFFQNHLGLQKGDSIALMAPNGFAFPITAIAAHMCGLTVVNVNPLYTPRELSHQLNDAKVTTLAVYDPITGTYGKIANETCVENIVIIGTEDFHENPQQPDVPDTIEKSVWMMDAIARGADSNFEQVTLHPDDLAFLQYTGGTTGPSKGAMLSHRNILSNITQCIMAWKERLNEGDEIIITALPLYHIFALTVNFLMFFKLGAKNIIIPNPRDIDGFIAALQDKKFTAMTGVNTLFAGLTQIPAFRELDFSRFDICVGGGAAVIESVAREWQKITGTTICQAYGLSETSPALTSNDITADAFRASVGFPVPGTKIKLIDNDGNTVPIGESGELCAKGPQVMRGYWNHDDVTTDVFTDDGFFKTGDIAVMGEDGFFEIIDRKKDMVNVSGFCVYPNEIEAIITNHEAVLESACIGVPDEKSGEAIKALVVLRENQHIGVDELRAYCKENMTAYKVPKYIVFVDELPKSTVGKILRRKLREQNSGA
ncbi:MAG: AMP-binding protein [Candidatus Thiodiazotropha endolucinida]